MIPRNLICDISGILINVFTEMQWQDPNHTNAQCSVSSQIIVRQNNSLEVSSQIWVINTYCKTTCVKSKLIAKWKNKSSSQENFTIFTYLFLYLNEGNLLREVFVNWLRGNCGTRSKKRLWQQFQENIITQIKSSDGFVVNTP